MVRLARKTFDRAASSGAAGVADVAGAVEELVEEDDGLARTFREGLTPHRQDVLRAVAASERGLATRAVLERFPLGSSGTVGNTVKAFVEVGHPVKIEGGSGCGFDSPFLRGWLVVHALPDLGTRLPATQGADAAG